MSIYVLVLCDNGTKTIHNETFSDKAMAEQTASILIDAEIYSSYEIIKTWLV